MKNTVEAVWLQTKLGDVARVKQISKDIVDVVLSNGSIPVVLATLDRKNHKVTWASVFDKRPLKMIQLFNFWVTGADIYAFRYMAYVIRKSKSKKEINYLRRGAQLGDDDPWTFGIDDAWSFMREQDAYAKIRELNIVGAVPEEVEM
ncbi:hypothetical protein EQG49_12700 [Periweissella cryptocerci]|uniref:Uncharacterized protein n=1 Tax=Periweissella cryptocerci TaxID=2506420 RepID=A0A4P6YWU8_9LACO|nr:hypothetical protein [Periweissella cryptocerci]QBO37257.1 hypothetical protein EQG49_12700 [Periweissella cryptocerci]